MDNGQLLESVKIVPCSYGATAAQTAVDGTVIDMEQDGGFDGIAFVAVLGTVTDGSVLTLAPMQGAASDGGDAAAISGAATAPVTASTSSSKILQTDTFRPTSRYVRPRLTRTTQNAVVQSIVAILYRSRNLPTSNHADVIGSKIAQA